MNSEEIIQLAEKLGNLQYDSLAEFLNALSIKLIIDAGNDASKNRHKLAEQLRKASDALLISFDAISEAWRLSKPFMETEDDRG